ncbi:MAG: hypothetical protein U9Q82_10630 [Chloroflexota bacterium]|nr:hypothetical protein [Chloroflexota bacterium]
MMIMAFPFDLRLWTGIDNGVISDAEIHTRFIERRNLIYRINKLLSQSAIPNCNLRIPLTQHLFEQLSMTPPWSDIQPGSNLYRLKRDVLRLLANAQKAAGLTFRIDVSESEHLYTWEGIEDFFSPYLVTMQESWIEMVGICAFEDTISARGFNQPVPVLGSCIVTTFSENLNVRITRRSLVDLDGDENEERQIPLLFQSDVWAWKRLIRELVWQEERLPIAPIGFSPRENWYPGERPRRHQNGYHDSLGGLWEWEGGRTVSDRNPFGGHWNVQLPNASVKHRWVNWIENCVGRKISTKPELVSHINVEPDGRIADQTFDWYE